MKQPSPGSRKGILHMLESLCNMGILPLSLTMGINSVIVSLQFLNGEGVDTKGLMELEQASDLSTAGVLMAALFFLMALARVMRAFRRREKGKAVFVVTLCQACAFAAVGGIALAFGVTVKTIYMAGLVYCVAMGAGRVVSIVRNHTPRNVVLNLICLIFLYFAFRFSTLLAFLIFLLAFISIINYIFSRVDLKMLKNIIRQTYAAEIIFGLLLLIFSFSIILSSFEPALAKYEDALWYCFAIVTTIGFGDFVAVGAIGRIISVILGVYGIIVVALITSIIVNFYGEVKKEHRLEQAEEEDGEDDPDPDPDL